MPDNTIKFDVLIEFLDDPAHHPRRAEILARLANDVAWRQEWREWQALRKLTRLTVTEDTGNSGIQEDEWPAFLDGALSHARMNQLKESLFVSRENREKLMLLCEALDAAGDGPTLPKHLYQQALTLGTTDGLTATERTTPSFFMAIADWLRSLSGWSVGLAGATAAAVVLVIVMTGGTEYSFPPATTDQVGRVQALAPTELKSIAFGERPPLASLRAMRMGYLAALVRDMIVLGNDHNLAPQFDLLAQLDPTLTEGEIVKIKSGHSPCADLVSSDESQCLAGAALYHLLRQGEPLNTDDLTRVQKAVSEIGFGFDDAIIHHLKMENPDLPSILRHLAVDYLW